MIGAQKRTAKVKRGRFAAVGLWLRPWKWKKKSSRPPVLTTGIHAPSSGDSFTPPVEDHGPSVTGKNLVTY